MGDRPIARLIPARDSTVRIKTRLYIRVFSGNRTHDPSIRERQIMRPLGPE
jgi:hypothetical protein